MRAEKVPDLRKTIYDEDVLKISFMVATSADVWRHHRPPSLGQAAKPHGAVRALVAQRQRRGDVQVEHQLWSEQVAVTENARRGHEWNGMNHDGIVDDDDDHDGNINVITTVSNV